VTGAAGAAQARGRGAVVLAYVTFAVLVAAGVGALFIAQAVKREIPLINGHSHSMGFPGRGHRFAHFHVRATLGGFVDVYVLSASGDRRVKQIASHERINEYQSFGLEWDGSNSAGSPAPVGDYVIEVHFEQDDRTAIVPNFVLTYRGAGA
jgi:hypothetical protein